MKATEINEIINKLNLNKVDRELFIKNLNRTDREFIEKLNNFII